MTVAARVLQAISDELEDRAPMLEALASGTITVVVKLDAAGCPRKIGVVAETERIVERRRPRALASV